jgi:uncharacterized membrane protein YbhN (UPF0104 family)
MSDPLRAAPAAPEKPQRSSAARALMVLRVAVPALAIGYLLSVVPLHEVLASISAMPVWAIVSAVFVLVTATATATLRWSLLLRACGLRDRPRFLELFRTYWIGAFYNTYVPGGLGGDVMRAIATRRCAGERGLPAALAVVFLERTLGLSGLLILVATSFTLFPLGGVPNVMLWSALGLSAAVCAVLAIVNGARIAPYLPAPLGRIAAALPTVESLPLFFLCLGLSVATQFCGVVMGHLLISSIASAVHWSDSLVILPLVGAAQYFPLTIGGAGAREAAFVLLYAGIGVAKADALATSLVIGGLMYTTSLAGGVLHVMRPLTITPADAAEAEAVAAQHMQHARDEG